MNEPLPRTISRPIQFTNGCAIGISNRWHKGQYCVLLTEAGLVGCGIYDVKTAGEFGQAIAIARHPRKTTRQPGGFVRRQNRRSHTARQGTGHSDRHERTRSGRDLARLGAENTVKRDPQTPFRDCLAMPFTFRGG